MPSFALTQRAHEGGTPIVFYAFDLLHLAGSSTAALGLLERKALLRRLIREGDPGLQFNAHDEGDGGALLAQACQLGLEGIVSKRADARYAPDDRGIWIKTKCVKRKEFVIVGWTDPDKSRVGFGALLLGYHDDAGKLQYAGRVGTGFSDEQLVSILQKLQPSAVLKMPIAQLPQEGGRGKPLKPKTTHWLKPTLVAEVNYREWPAGGLLRHSSFVGLREDKPARQVRREG